MTARFGRNKRRAAREQIAALEDQNMRLVQEVNVAQREILSTLRALRRARTEALEDFMQSGDFYRYVIEKMGQEVARSAGEQFATLARMVFEERMSDMVFSLRPDIGATEESVDIIGIRLPPVEHYIAVPRFEGGAPSGV